jgi:hypothetical protein
MIPPEVAMREELAKLDADIKELCDEKHKRFRPYRVFAVYNTEHSKRDCIDGKRVTYVEHLMGDSGNPVSKFKGKVVRVVEPGEPSDILYEETDVSFVWRAVSWALSFLLCAGFIIISFFIVNAIQISGSGQGVAVFLTVSNSLLPTIIIYSTLYLESHVLESQRQTSILFKLFLMRCINSGVLIYLATDFDQMFSIKHLQAIQGILIADATYGPVLRVVDPLGIVFRYVVSKLVSNTQVEMDAYWRGNDFYLAERYTDLLKSIFVGLFFLVPLPSALFVSCFAMLNTYACDKYCLFYLWRRPKAVDHSMSIVARYMLAFTILAHVCVSRVFFANWPYAVRTRRSTTLVVCVCPSFSWYCVLPHSCLPTTISATSSTARTRPS